MATLAALLKQKGHDVQGSDENVYPPMSTFLASEKIRTLSGYSAEHITSKIDLVVVGNAISRGNVELEAVLERKMRYCSLPEAVREHFLWSSRSIVIAGTHGKTTTTSLTGWLLVHGGLDPSILVGGIARNLGEDGSSYRLGKGKDFVIEGDEYDSAYFDKTAKFLKYLPDIAVINNVEFDHADIYADIDAVRLAFRRLVNLVPRSGLLLLGRRFAGRAGAEESGREPGRDVRSVGVGRLARNRRDGLRGGAVVQRPPWRVALRDDADSAVRLAQRPQRDGVDRRGARAVDTGGDHRGRAAEIPGREAPARDFRRGRRRDGVRRLRASSDGDCRDARGPARRQSSSPDLGDFRAAVRLVQPPGVSAGLRARVRAGGRSDHRAGVSNEPAGRRAAVGASSSSQISRARASAPGPPRRSTTSLRRL